MVRHLRSSLEAFIPPKCYLVGMEWIGRNIRVYAITKLAGLVKPRYIRLVFDFSFDSREFSTRGDAYKSRINFICPSIPSPIHHRTSYMSLATDTRSLSMTNSTRPSRPSDSSLPEEPNTRKRKSLGSCHSQTPYTQTR